MKVLVTGTAGFIGFHLVQRLLNEGHEVVGLDNINDYYDVNLKLDRLKETGIVVDREELKKSEKTSHNSESSSEGGDSSPLRSGEGSGVRSLRVESQKHPNYTFVKLDLNDREGLKELFEEEQFDVVIHLAAQAGVRYSLENPHAYIDSNISGFLNILEGCRHNPVDHLIYASSSSVYGSNTKMPFATSDFIDHPVSLYAATKKSNELMAHTYSHLFDIPSTGLRFFTVYGPWGRPDMALFLFTEAMLKDEPIDVYNYGNMERDFTYIDDIVESIVRLIPKAPEMNANKKDLPSPEGEGPGVRSKAPYRVFNIGHGSPVQLMDFIHEIEKNLDTEAEKNMMEMQPGDVPKTWADVEDLFELIDYRPKVKVQEGIREFVKWYREYYRV